MHNDKPQVFIDTQLSELARLSEDYASRGWRFANICGSSVDGGVEMIYSFSKGLELENLRFVVGNDAEIASVSERFPNAFFFENETHDLFGVRFSGISIDFDGEFYTVSVPTPMNPRSAAAQEAADAGSYGAANYGACPVPGAAAAAVSDAAGAAPATESASNQEAAAAPAAPAAATSAAPATESALDQEAAPPAPAAAAATAAGAGEVGSDGQ
jgi:hypothetical protein